MRVLLFALLATSTSSLQARSWQRRLDKALLDVDTTPKGRVKLLQRAFQDPGLAADLRKSVQTIQEKGFGKGHPEVIETLWPKGTIAREDIEGLVALRNQIPEAIKQFQSRGPSANDDAASSVAATGTPPNPNELLGSIGRSFSASHSRLRFESTRPSPWRAWAQPLAPRGSTRWRATSSAGTSSRRRWR